jgi:hypothetical protein
MPQILVPSPSSRKQNSSNLQKLVVSSFMTSTREVSSGEHPSTTSTVEYTAAQSTVTSLTTPA